MPPLARPDFFFPIHLNLVSYVAMANNGLPQPADDVASMKNKVDHILTLKEVKKWVKADPELKARLESFKQMAEVRARGGLLFCKELGIDPATDPAGVNIVCSVSAAGLDVCRGAAGRAGRGQTWRATPAARSERRARM